MAEDGTEKFKTLQRLRDQGLITPAEFAKEERLLLRPEVPRPVFAGSGRLKEKIKSIGWLVLGLFLLVFAMAGAGSEGFTATVLAVVLLGLASVTMGLSGLIKQRAIVNILHGKILNVLGILFAALVIYFMTQSTQGTGFMRGLTILLMIGVIAIAFYNLKQKDS